MIGHGLIQGISLHTTKIPRYDFKELLTRLYEIITDAPTKTTIKPIIINNDVYEDVKGDFEKIMSTGEGIIFSLPKYKVINNNIYIYGKPPGGFSKLLAFNEKYEETNSKSYATIIDNSGEKLEIIISPKKGAITKEFTDKIMNLIMEKIHIKCNVVVEDGTVEMKGIDTIITNTYSKWKLGYKVKISNDLVKLQNKLAELNIISAIRLIIEQNPTVKTIQDICDLNTTNFNNKDIESVCSKHRIKTLIEANIDIPGIQAQITNTQYELSNIDSFALKRIESLLGK